MNKLNKKLKAARAERGATVKGQYPPMTLNRAAQVFGLTKEKLTRVLNEAGVEYGAGKKFTVRQVGNALAGDTKRINAELKQVELKTAKLELQRKQNELITVSESCQYLLDTYGPLRQMVVEMPSKLAALVCPSDPPHALAHLEKWRDEFLKRRVSTPAVKTDETASHG